MHRLKICIQDEPKNTLTQNHDISEMREYFCTEFRLFVQKTTTQNVLLCAVFTGHTPNWRKRKLQERILQLHRLQKGDFIINVINLLQLHHTFVVM